MGIFILALIFGVSVTAQQPRVTKECPIDNSRHLPIYDMKNNSGLYNGLRYDKFIDNFTENGYYQFKDDFNVTGFGFMYYEGYPFLAVYQPDESKDELHGYHYPLGLSSIYDKEHFDETTYENYQSFRDYLNSPIDKIGYTPTAALRLHPELEQYKMTKLILDPKDPKYTFGFSVLFLLPEKGELKSNSFDDDFKFFEEYYYSDSEICK